MEREREDVRDTVSEPRVGQFVDYDVDEGTISSKECCKRTVKQMSSLLDMTAY
jgi:hypothetical protein